MRSQIFYTSLFLMLTLPGCKVASSQSVKNANAETLTEIPAQTQTDLQYADSNQQHAFLVDDPNNENAVMQEDPRKHADEILAQAQHLLDSGNYSQAFKLAIEGYILFPGRDIYDFAFYAASRLTPIEQTRLDEHATTHIERAILGQLRLSHCAAQSDNTCIQAIQTRTADALRAIGEPDDAARIEALTLDTSKNQAPLVAVLLPLSGSDRKIGRAMLGSMIQAAGTYHGDSLPFNLRFFDTQSNVSAIPAVLEEIEKSGAKFILGPIDVQESQAVAKRLHNQVMVGFSPNSSFIGQKTNVFQFSYTMDKEIQTVAELIQSNQLKRIAVIGPDDTYVSTATNQLKQKSTTDTEISSFTYPATQTDLRETAQKAAKYEPDVIFLPTTADASERIMSFMAQENIWCAKPGTPKPKSAADTRKFVTCVSTSLWTPIQNQRYKFIQNALYLDYTDNASAQVFVTQFETLYHRTPAVYEVLPYYLMQELKKLPRNTYNSHENLQNELKHLFNGSDYAMIPNTRMITNDLK